MARPKTAKTQNLLPCCHTPGRHEAGCDEAGRGCLAGPVYAAAVILPEGFTHPLLNDSKQLTERQRDLLREVIEAEAEAWSVAWCDAAEIDDINILNASILAMHRALDALALRPDSIIVDGNRFKPYGDTPWQTFVKGDGRYGNIAAASILAKTHRDSEMRRHVSRLRLGNQQGIPHQGTPPGHRRAWAHAGAPHDIPSARNTTDPILTHITT